MHEGVAGALWIVAGVVVARQRLLGSDTAAWSKGLVHVNWSRGARLKGKRDSKSDRCELVDEVSSLVRFKVLTLE